MSDKILVAVYGTLKKGQSNHSLLSGSKLIGSGETPPHYTLLEMGSYPGATFGDSKLKVEVYEVDALTLRDLDRLEGHPDFYRRTLVPIEMDDNIEYTEEAWMYTVAHLSANYTQRPICTTFDELNRINWRYRHGLSW